MWLKPGAGRADAALDGQVVPLGVADEFQGVDVAGYEVNLLGVLSAAP